MSHRENRDTDEETGTNKRQNEQGKQRQQQGYREEAARTQKKIIIPFPPTCPITWLYCLHMVVDGIHKNVVK